MTFSDLMNITYSCQPVAVFVSENVITGPAEILNNFMCNRICSSEVEEILTDKDGKLKVWVKV